MNNIKTSLVLEGGGMRGAYTAGALSWLIENNIEFDNAYGISTGAVYLCIFLLKDLNNLFNYSVDYIRDKNVIGIKSIIKCGHVVNYDYLFNHLIKDVSKFSMDKLHNVRTNAKIGVYELNENKTIYHDVKNVSFDELKAACTLPLLGKTVNIGNRKLLDGGITDMIPINQSIKDGCNRHLIITTKPKNYVRKPSNKFVVSIMKARYQFSNIGNDYSIRHLNYNKQISAINDLVNKNEALYIPPSKPSNVTRLGGSRDELMFLFNLGKQDMENKKEEILKLFKK